MRAPTDLGHAHVYVFSPSPLPCVRLSVFSPCLASRTLPPCLPAQSKGSRETRPHPPINLGPPPKSRLSSQGVALASDGGRQQIAKWDGGFRMGVLK
jgi:hypothetical protein